MNFLTRLVATCSAAAFALLLPAVHAQAPAQTTVSPNQVQPAAFKMEEIEQLVAPIALYPDSLIAQILMASTYPLEVVSAARWSKANPGVKDKALEDAMQQQPWDPSVKSLAAFPQVLQMMNEKLDMTQRLGDAFLAQQKDVLDAVQRLRGRADQAGNLKSGNEQTVTKAQEGGQTVIKIEPANPQVLQVPTYDPTVVYGTWPYPAYPPYYYYPPYYVPGAALFTFAAGVAIGSALWGGCNWGGGGVYINHNNYNNFNRTNVKGGDWQHNAEHRKGAGYRDQRSQQRYGGGQRQGLDSREAFRGRAEQGRQEIARGGANEFKGRGGADRGGSMGNRGGMGDRGSPGAGTRNPGGFSGVGGGGAQTRDFSNRGAASRSSAASTSRAGGGGARAGGGGGGGGARAGGGGGARAGGGGRRR
jgi:uncharacterized protein DUF3300